MVRGIYVQPDTGISRIFQVARFAVPIEMPDAHVRDRAFPEAATEWIVAFDKRGYTLDSKIYLFPRAYAHMELPDTEVGRGTYEHDQSRRVLVDRRMAAYFRVRDIVTDVLPDAEKAAILAHIQRDLDARRMRV